MKNEARSILYHTRDIESNDIKAPRIEVNPQRKITKCRVRELLILSFCISK